MDISYAKSESYDTPDSDPWGVGSVPSGPVAAYGQAAEDGIYDTRDDSVGGTDSEWNQTDDHLSGANWASGGDTARVSNSGSGLGGERARFTDALSQDSLAGNADNTGNFSPV